MTRFILTVFGVLALAELAPARAQFALGAHLGYSGGYGYSRSEFGYSFGGSRYRVNGFSGGFVARSFAPWSSFGFLPVGPFGFVPVGGFPFGNPFLGGWGPAFGFGSGSGYGPGFGFGPPVIGVPVPVPVIINGTVPNPSGDGTTGALPGRNDALPQGIRPKDFVVIAPKREVTVPDVPRVAAVPRPAKPALAIDPLKPPAAVKAETPEAEPKKEAARLVGLARASFAAGDYGRAAEHFDRAIAVDPTAAELYFGYAQAKFASGQYAEAVARIRAGLARDPKWPAAAFDPAALYADRPERFVVHVLALRKAVADNPNQATLEFLLGYELWFSGEKVEADKLFRAAEKRLAAPGPLALFK